MIKIENLVKVYENGFKAVNDISLEVKKGEIFGIIGLSGAGKSSLIRCINRLEEPTSGNIFIDGKDIVKMNDKELKDARKNMSMIFQSFNLFYQKNVFENIAYPLKINGWKKEDIEKRVKTLLEYVNLSEKIFEYPANLSGGQKQRVAIARALAIQPKILLCDEATSALDPQSTKSILELLLRIRDEFNLTIILITHQMEVVKAICDRAGVIENGKIIEQDTVLKLFTSPKTQTTKNFIENLPEFTDYEKFLSEDYSGFLLRLGFTKETSTKPVISELIRQKNIDVNIISGNIDKIKEGKVGHLIVEVFEKDRIDEIKTFLEERKILVEEVI
ncbi:methionine ABC transporter ATP-binding protein [Parvimonas parva]|uniref:ATP-binding cassette domain-containing protein n=1 Tax=Parvimonas parva TaxID=2769485 RepID=A0ABS1C952_9FIRM|nr:ATP-binding cassette domain-containing protein [Parvimonas parva]MBK1468623.1 ATP-binding cassette domain-containing protein [Parvimonas parva]